MDLATIRAQLPSMTRAVFGEAVSVHPMIEGKMGPASADPSRPVLVDIMARFDLAPEMEQLGGGRETSGRAQVVSSHSSVSFAAYDLSWTPVRGDHVLRRNPKTGVEETHRIDRLLEPLPAVLLYLVSRI